MGSICLRAFCLKTEAELASETSVVVFIHLLHDGHSPQQED